MKRLLLAIILFLMMGCSYTPNEVVIQIDSTFSTDKQQLILDSLNDWILKTKGGFDVSSITIVNGITPQTEYNTIKFLNQDIETESAAPHTGIVGLTDPVYITVAHPNSHVQAVIRIWDGESDKIFVSAVRHEIGHALLINHYCTEAMAQESWTACEVVSANPQPSVMYPSVKSFQVVEPIDVQRFCNFWGCPK